VETIDRQWVTKFGMVLTLIVLTAGLSLPSRALSGATKHPRQGSRSVPNPPNNSVSQRKPPANGGNNGSKGNQGEGGNSGGNGRAGAGVPQKFVEKLQDMSPDQQERFMKNNERFQNMPPNQQAQIRQNLQRWNSLTPEQRGVIRARQAAIEQMSPQERQYVHQVVQPAWRDMAPAPRRFMNQHLRELYGMSAPEAEAKLNDPAFLRGMTPEQQKMMPYLYRMRVGAAPEPQGPPEY
jgi:hypothetical protein